MPAEKEKEPQKEPPTESLNVLIEEVEWLREVIELRNKEQLMGDFSREIDLTLSLPIPQPGNYSKLIEKYKLDYVGRVILVLAVAAEYDQSVFAPLMRLNPESMQLDILVGGQFDKTKNMFMPTFQTALFVLSGNNRMLRAKYSAQLCDGHILLDEQILYSANLNGLLEHLTQGIIEIDESYYRYLLTGNKPRLDHGKYFPAELKKTAKSFDDIVLSDALRNKFTPVIYYMLSAQNNYYTEVNHRFNKGYVVMLYGPPGTGKTYVTTILGNTFGKDVYRVDLSRVVSKYIGETEKNLKLLFDRLQGKDCLLFFDEADAIFGKRSEVEDAKDRFANQEISYLLQRVEEFDGLTVLCTNFENNLDDAFQRRINVKIHMTRPREPERRKLWEYYLPEGFDWINNRLLDYLSESYEFTGAHIKNILEMVTLQMHHEDLESITYDVLLPYLDIECDKAFGRNFQLKPATDYGNLNEADED